MLDIGCFVRFGIGFKFVCTVVDDVDFSKTGFELPSDFIIYAIYFS